MAERLTSASKSKLPIASVISDPDTFREAVDILNKLTANKVRQDELKEQEVELKARAAAICEAFNLPGFRHGLNKFEYFGWTTKNTLSKEKLLELGVPAETIAAAYSQSDPFMSCKSGVFDFE